MSLAETGRPFLPALAIALVAMLSGTGMGVAFGVAEESLKGSLKESASAVLQPVYEGDQARADAVVAKSWSYVKRAHLHAGALGTEALAITLLLALLLPTTSFRRLRVAAATMTSLGALGYGWFWWFAAFRAPGLGSTGAAKESLGLLAIPSSAGVVLGTVLAIALIGLAWRHQQTDQA